MAASKRVKAGGSMPPDAEQEAPKSSASAAPEAPPGQIRVGKLDSLESVRNELGRLYRQARRNAGDKLDAATACKLGFLLNSIGRQIEGSDLEKRVMELERRTKR